MNIVTLENCLSCNKPKGSQDYPYGLCPKCQNEIIRVSAAIINGE